MKTIIITKPSAAELEALKVTEWPIWECDPSHFDWFYDDKEVCYILEGEVTVKTADDVVTFGKGDLVTFPAGLSCEWNVHKKVRKHYKFGD